MLPVAKERSFLLAARMHLFATSTPQQFLELGKRAAVTETPAPVLQHA